MLIRSEKGAIKPGLQVNANIPLCYAPEWQGVLAYNTFHHRVDVLIRPPYNNEPDFVPRPLEDVDIVETRAWLETAGIQANKTIVYDAIQKAARANKYHPVCDYLDKLTWDGQPRLDTWLIATSALTIHPCTGPIPPAS
jgi:putative DNA primase/helicase